jgi:antitoxin component YwqK of YwqJK toxin-antitoxin module
MSAEIEIAEFNYHTGAIKFRFARYLAADGSHWIRQGRFQAFYENGQAASEGQYEQDKESGLWRNFHENGQVAAEGRYEAGKKVGEWRYWDASGATTSGQ